MGLVSTTSVTVTCTKACGVRTKDTEKGSTTIRMGRFTEECISWAKERVKGPSIIKMGIDTKGSGETAILKGSVHITIALESFIWGTTKITKEMD